MNGATGLLNPVEIDWDTLDHPHTLKYHVKVWASDGTPVLDLYQTPPRGHTLGTLSPGGTYHWAIKSLNCGDSTAFTPEFTFTMCLNNCGGGVSPTPKTENELPQEFRLDANFPNPFNPMTTIRYALPSPEHVTLAVFDLLGREIRTLVNAYEPAGEKSIVFDGSSLTSGVYFYRLRAGSFESTKKLLLSK